MFKIRHGKETHVYRTESAQDKKSLLAQFRQVAEELAAKKRKEREGEHERRKSLWQAGTSGGDVRFFNGSASKCIHSINHSVLHMLLRRTGWQN